MGTSILASRSIFSRDAVIAANLASSRQRAVAVSETAGDKVGQMLVHLGQAQVFAQRGDFTQALTQVTAAEAMLPASTDLRLRVNLLRVKFVVHMQTGDFESAQSEIRELSPILRSLNDDEGGAENYLCSAWAFQSLGDIPYAIKNYEDAFTLFSKTGNYDGKVRTRIGIGSLYQSLGQYEEAVAQYELAYPLASNDERVTILMNSAEILQTFGKPLQASQNYWLAQLRLPSDVDPLIRIRILSGRGRAWTSVGNFNSAEAFLTQAGVLAESTSNAAAKASVAASLGELDYWRAIGSPDMDPTPRFKQALIHYDQALPLMRAIGDRSGEIGVLTNMGLVYDAKGKSKEALAYYTQALEKMEWLETQARLEEFRGNIADQSAPLYARAIQLALDTHQPEMAFAFSERARARLFLDRLGNARIDDKKQAPPEFLSRENQLRKENISLERRLGKELSRPGAELDREGIAALQSRLTAVRASYETLMNDLKLSNPRYAAFLNVSPITLAETQTLLDPATTVVSFYAEQGETIAFVLTKNTFKVKRLKIGQAELIHEISTFRDFAGESEVSPTLRVLYEALIAPIRSELKTSKLIFIPHGTLHELPFGALTHDGNRFLSDDFSISYLPSVSALSYLHRKTSSSAPQALVLVSNQEEGFPQLSSAGEEGNAVAAFFETKSLLGKEATAGVLRKDAANYGILHLVAHFEINRKNPMASRILLGRGEKGDDSPLDLSGVYGLHLAKTDLVVLSGCETQNGKRTRGDDIIGLSQAFLYAGSSSVIASLWKVDDEATKLLMVAFYTHLRQGLSKADALRVAQTEVRRKYPSPFYWAGFVLNGDPGGLTGATTTVAAN
jgi:CHAT domain-containing protein/tetratricopeptide (TPR) repeat protein